MFQEWHTEMQIHLLYTDKDYGSHWHFELDSKACVFLYHADRPRGWAVIMLLKWWTPHTCFSGGNNQGSKSWLSADRHTQVGFLSTRDPRLTDSFGVVSGPQQQLRGPVPERHHHRVQVCQRLEGGVEESCETHVSCRRRSGEETGRVVWVVSGLQAQRLRHLT